MADFEMLTSEFRNLILPNGWVERLHTGMRWAEGPVWFGDGGYVVWSDVPNNRMLQWVDGLGVRTFRQPSSYANGNTRDRDGRLITCEHGTRRVTRTEIDGRITVLADRYKGKRLNSPNDVVVKSDGSIWFTDPPYGIMSDYEGHKADMELDGCYVFRLDARTGDLTVVADDFVRPNGIAFSPDERRLYVSDTSISHDPNGNRHIRVFDVDEKGRLSHSRVFAVVTPGSSDGFRLDTAGNVWTSAGDGVHCYAPDGTLLGKIRIPETVSNLCFGGPKRNRLFITATTSLYSVYVGVNGAGHA
ncbi:MAG TPA: SMP-30/gluconolactonase/LRE family protein [Alphaproteobacteria bacterium]